jgi:hypothetical protein
MVVMVDGIGVEKKRVVRMRVKILITITLQTKHRAVHLSDHIEEFTHGKDIIAKWHQE